MGIVDKVLFVILAGISATTISFGIVRAVGTFIKYVTLSDEIDNRELTLTNTCFLMGMAFFLIYFFLVYCQDRKDDEPQEISIDYSIEKEALRKDLKANKPEAIEFILENMEE